MVGSLNPNTDFSFLQLLWTNCQNVARIYGSQTFSIVCVDLAFFLYLESWTLHPYFQLLFLICLLSFVCSTTDNGIRFCQYKEILDLWLFCHFFYCFHCVYSVNTQCAIVSKLQHFCLLLKVWTFSGNQLSLGCLTFWHIIARTLGSPKPFFDQCPAVSHSINFWMSETPTHGDLGYFSENRKSISLKTNPSRADKREQTHRDSYFILILFPV